MNKKLYLIGYLVIGITTGTITGILNTKLICTLFILIALAFLWTILLHII